LTKGRVIIADKVHPLLLAGLRQMDFQPWEAYRLPVEAVLAEAGDAVGLIIRSRFPVQQAFLSAMSRLQFIGRVGAGLENIDVPFAEERGILVLNAPEGNANAVAEHALGMLLALLRHLPRADREVREGQWRREENRGDELAELCVGIIGCGHMGSAFAQKVQPLARQVLTYDKYKKEYAPPGVEEVSLAELQRKADVVSLHVPQSPENLGLIDEAYLAGFDKPIIFINTARGKSLQTEALVAALQSGKVRGACLDVLEYEKNSFEQLFAGPLPAPLGYLLQSERVIISPHIAGWTHASERKMAETLLQKLKNNGF